MRNDSGESRERAPDVGVLLKALDVLEALVFRGEMGLTELSRATDTNKASVYRVLNTLERRGFVVKDADTRKYTPGHRLIAISLSIIRAVDLVRIARPVLRGLRDEFGETVNLGVLDDGEVQYLDIVEGSHGLRMSARPGARDHLHSTGLGKALLSALEPVHAESLLRGGKRPKLTPRTVTRIDALMAELAEARYRGYALDDEENEVGARCIAVPVLDRDGRPLAAISVSGPSARMEGKAVPKIASELQRASRTLADLVGEDSRGGC